MDVPLAVDGFRHQRPADGRLRGIDVGRSHTRSNRLGGNRARIHHPQSADTKSEGGDMFADE